MNGFYCPVSWTQFRVCDKLFIPRLFNPSSVSFSLPEKPTKELMERRELIFLVPHVLLMEKPANKKERISRVSFGGESHVCCLSDQTHRASCKHLSRKKWFVDIQTLFLFLEKGRHLLLLSLLSPSLETPTSGREISMLLYGSQTERCTVSEGRKRVLCSRGNQSRWRKHMLHLACLPLTILIGFLRSLSHSVSRLRHLPYVFSSWFSR